MYCLVMVLSGQVAAPPAFVGLIGHPLRWALLTALADSYYHLDLDRCADALAETGAALHPALRRQDVPPALPDGSRRSRRIAVLFVCTGNSARSPMAEALLRKHAADRVTVTSAGSRPKPQLHRNTVRVLDDPFGISVAGQ